MSIYPIKCSRAMLDELSQFEEGEPSRCACHLTMRCSGRLWSARRLQGQAPAWTGFDQQAARRLRAAADRGR